VNEDDEPDDGRSNTLPLVDIQPPFYSFSTLGARLFTNSIDFLCVSTPQLGPDETRDGTFGILDELDRLVQCPGKEVGFTFGEDLSNRVHVDA
jgi:hypothetical protein